MVKAKPLLSACAKATLTMLRWRWAHQPSHRPMVMAISPWRRSKRYAPKTAELITMPAASADESSF